jgi:hypothetical protein
MSRAINFAAAFAAAVVALGILASLAVDVARWAL